MAFDAHKNFSYSTVATVPSPAVSGTTLIVQTGDGSKFPAVSFNATVWPTGVIPTTANAEIVRVTTIAGDTFTITRATESSTARTIVVGDQIAATVTNKTLTDIENAATAWPYAVVKKTATYTAVAWDNVDCTSGTFTVTLPAASSNANKNVIVTNTGSGTITVGRTGSDTIGNKAETSQTLNAGDSMTFSSDGTSVWMIN